MLIKVSTKVSHLRNCLISMTSSPVSISLKALLGDVPAMRAIVRSDVTDDHIIPSNYPNHDFLPNTFNIYRLTEHPSWTSIHIVERYRFSNTSSTPFHRPTHSKNHHTVDPHFNVSCFRYVAHIPIHQTLSTNWSLSLNFRRNKNSKSQTANTECTFIIVSPKEKKYQQKTIQDENLITQRERALMTLFFLSNQCFDHRTSSQPLITRWNIEAHAPKVRWLSYETTGLWIVVVQHMAKLFHRQTRSQSCCRISVRGQNSALLQDQ